MSLHQKQSVEEIAGLYALSAEEQHKLTRLVNLLTASGIRTVWLSDLADQMYTYCLVFQSMDEAQIASEVFMSYLEGKDENEARGVADSSLMALMLHRVESNGKLMLFYTPLP